MLVFTPGDVDALAGCMQQLITDEELYDKIQKASVNLADKRFSMSEINRQLGNLYKRIL
jgi:glycosyltransferase involved in cell wall biosynthesis